MAGDAAALDEYDVDDDLADGRVDARRDGRGGGALDPVGVARPEEELITQAEVAAQIAQAPTRFRGLVTTDLTRPMEAVREIRRLVDRT